jgi:predicted secreted hydrolase
MSNKTQINRPLKGHSHAEIDSTERGKIVLPSAIQLPRDMYLHLPSSVTDPVDGCPKEWWWHVGTLKTEGGRTFGFEINAAAFYPRGFTEVMLTDVKHQKHYHETKVNLSILSDWAESDQTKPWKVNLEDVSMSAPQADPTKNMKVTAKLVDDKTTVNFDLMLSLQGSPLIVWGNGVNPVGPPTPTLGKNNFYFSLTRLKAAGTISIGTSDKKSTPEIHNVTGVTWMDHEWGKFGEAGHSLKWILQDMQLDNGVCLSNYSMKEPVLNVSAKGVATIQLGENAASILVSTTLTPKKMVKINGKEFFTEVLVEIPSCQGTFLVKTLMPNQVFMGNVYEGVASVKGTMKGIDDITIVTGTAWMEQTFQS